MPPKKDSSNVDYNPHIQRAILLAMVHQWMPVMIAGAEWTEICNAVPGLEGKEKAAIRQKKLLFASLGTDIAGRPEFKVPTMKEAQESANHGGSAPLAPESSKRKLLAARADTSYSPRKRMKVEVGMVDSAAKTKIPAKAGESNERKGGTAAAAGASETEDGAVVEANVASVAHEVALRPWWRSWLGIR